LLVRHPQYPSCIHNNGRAAEHQRGQKHPPIASVVGTPPALPTLHTQQRQGRGTPTRAKKNGKCLLLNTGKAMRPPKQKNFYSNETNYFFIMYSPIAER
jgi:hypothetical protein